MLRQEEEKNPDNILAHYDAFKKSGVRAKVDVETMEIAHFFKTSEEAQQFKSWLEQHSFLDIGGDQEIPVAIEIENEDIIFVVTLSQNLLDTLFGEGYFVKEAAKNQYDAFIKCLDGNVDKILLLMETPFFEHSPENQSAIFAFTDAAGNNFLHTAVSYLNKEELTNIAQLIHSDVLNNALLMLNKDNKTVLTLAMTKKSSSAFHLLASKLSTEMLERILERNPEILIDVFHYQSPAVIADLIKKIHSFDALRARLTPRLALQIADHLLNEPSWQNEDLIEKSFAIAGNVIAPLCYQFWLNGNEISATMQEAILDYIDNKNFPEEKALSAYTPTTNSEVFAKGLPLITTSRGTVIEFLNLEDAKTMAVLNDEGFASIQDYRILRKMQNEIKGLSETLDNLFYSRPAFIGMDYPASEEEEEEKDDHLDSNRNKKFEGGLDRLQGRGDLAAPVDEEKEHHDLSQLEEIFERDCALIQRVRLENWQQYQSQIKDYEFRPKVGKFAHPQRIRLTHEFDHLNNKIIPYKPEEPNADNNFIRTQAMAAVHVTSQLNNAVPGENDSENNSIYLLLDRNDCHIKAMFTESQQIHQQQWVGIYEEVENYADKVAASSKTTFAAFSNEVKMKPHQLNKVLAEITLPAIRAVVIPIDSALSRDIANKAVASLKKLDKQVPIIFYNRVLRTIRFYSPAEQEKDLLKPLVNKLQETVNDETQFTAVFNSLPQEQKGQVVIKQAAPNESTILHALATSPLNHTIYPLALNALSPAELELGLLFQSDERGATVLHLGLVYHAEATLSALKRINRKALASILMQADHMHSNCLHQAAKYLKSDQFSEFLSLIATQNDNTALSSTLVKPDFFGRTALSYAAQTQTPENFDKLLALTSRTAINIACMLDAKKGFNIINLALAKKEPDVDNSPATQSPENVMRLINMSDDRTLRQLFYGDAVGAALVKQIIDNILHQAEWQQPAFISRLLEQSFFGQALLTQLVKFWIEGNKLPPVVFNTTQAFLNTINDNQLSQPLRELKYTIEPESEDLIKWNDAHPHIFSTSQNVPIDVYGRREAMLRLIWAQGLKSWTDYRLLRQQSADVRGLEQTLDALYAANCVLVGLNVPYQREAVDGDAIKEADAKGRLLQLKQDIVDAKNLTKFSLFGGMPRTLTNLMETIQQAEASNQWSRFYESAKKELSAGSSISSWSRNKSTQEFYEKEMKSVFRR